MMFIVGYVYPEHIQILGWLIEFFPLSIPLILGLYSAGRRILRGQPREAAFLRSGPLLSPSSKWGPREDRPKLEIDGILNEAF